MEVVVSYLNMLKYGDMPVRSQAEIFKVPSLTGCDCIKKIWKDDPFICPECMGLMKIISFIQAFPIGVKETRCH